LRSERHEPEGRDARQRGAALGLVRSTTKFPLVGSSIAETVTLNTGEARVKRMRKAVITSARLLQDEMTQSKHRFRVVMVTLTYAPDRAWVGQHVREFINHCRKFLARRGHSLRYVWVAELQERGAVHYHVVLWLPRGVTLPKPDKRGWWPHGLTRIEWARRPVGYIAKYASKGSSGAFPKGCRTHGSGGLTRDARQELRWWQFPLWIRERFDTAADVVRSAGGGFLSRASGDWVPAMWEVVSAGGGLVQLRRKLESVCPS